MAEEGGRGGGADDRAGGAGGQQAGDRQPRGQEGAGEVDVEHALPLLQRQQVRRGVDLDAGVGEHERRLAELLRALRQRSLELLLDAHVGGERERLRGAGGARLRRDPLGAVAVGVDDRDARAALRRQQRDRRPDPRRGAGHEGDGRTLFSCGGHTWPSIDCRQSAIVRAW